MRVDSFVMSENCSIDGCGRRAGPRRGWCNAHYKRWRKYGDPTLISRRPPGTALSFLQGVAAVFDSDECLIWPYRLSKNGYGTLRTGAKNRYAHRVLCEIIHGTPPNALDAAHSCGNRACVNPRHLRWASRSDNLHDARGHGTIGGELNAQSKLTSAEVINIRRRLVAGERVTAIARNLHVSSTCISDIRRRRTWGHLP